MVIDGEIKTLAFPTDDFLENTLGRIPCSQTCPHSRSRKFELLRVLLSPFTP